MTKALINGCSVSARFMLDMAPCKIYCQPCSGLARTNKGLCPQLNAVQSEQTAFLHPYGPRSLSSQSAT